MKIRILLLLLLTATFNGFGQQLDSLLNKLEKSTDSVEIVDLNIAISELAHAKGEYDLAIKHANEVVKKSFYINDLQGRGIAFNVIAASYIRLADFDKALQFQDSALAVAEKRDDKKDIAACFNNYGNILSMKGNYQAALEYHIDALKLSKEIDDLEGLSASHANAGNVYYYLKDFDHTIFHYLEAAKGYEALDNPINQMIIEINTGDVYLEKNELDSALIYFKTVLEYHEEVGNPNLSAENYIKLGATYTRLNEFELALDYLQKGREVKEMIQDKNGLANVYKSLGECYLNLGDLDQAKEFLELAKEYATYVQSLKFLSETHLLLSKLYERKNDFESSLSAFKTHTSLNDSILNKESLDRISELKVEFEAEQKDAEIEILTKNAEIKNLQLAKQRNIILSIILISIFLSGIIFFFIERRNAKYRLHNINLELEALRSQMKPHFIFNALNSILHFIESNKNKEAGSYLLKFSKLIRTTLNNTLQDEILLEEELNALKEYVQIESLNLERKLALEIQVESSIDTKNILISSLMLQPLVENAIWHGISPKQEDGTISILISKEKQKLVCEIVDNGIGINAKGSKRHNSQSLGTKLTKQRLELVNKKYKTNCELSYVSNKGGTIARLEHPWIEEF